MTALITGITGFVGSYLAEEITDKGDEVYGLVRRRSDCGKPKTLIEKGIVNPDKLVDGDITDLTSLLHAIEVSQPDVIFHLAAQSYVPRSFIDPLETFRVNCLGTQNLLEAVRLKDLDCRIVFAGSSEEYGLQISSKRHYRQSLETYKVIFPEPQEIPELPIGESNPLRPMSPYAVSKVSSDFLMRNYFHVYGLKTIVSRAFNHEGAGRGAEFVTSTIVDQCVKLKYKEVDKIRIGNINVFRDWSHVRDIVQGYLLLAEKGTPGDTYIQGSMRTNSVLTYILLTLQNLGYKIHEVRTFEDKKIVKEPIAISNEDFFNAKFEKTKIDELILKGELEYKLEDKGLKIKTDKDDLIVEFDPVRFRPAEVPILLSNTRKIQNLGFRCEKNLTNIIRDQTNFYLNPVNR